MFHTNYYTRAVCNLVHTLCTNPYTYNLFVPALSHNPSGSFRFVLSIVNLYYLPLLPALLSNYFPSYKLFSLSFLLFYIRSPSLYLFLNHTAMSTPITSHHPLIVRSDWWGFQFSCCLKLLNIDRNVL